MTTRAVSAVILAATLSLAACAKTAVVKEPTTPIDLPTSSAGMTHPIRQVASVTDPTRQLAVSDGILEACHIDVSNVARAPKFDFDQSDIQQDDRDVLVEVARCFTTGPLAGHALRLVGRADPRGEDEYNMALGGSRAASVKEYLARLGVDASKISTSSRGKLDATGTDEPGWRLDRRVDLLMAGRGA